MLQFLIFLSEWLPGTPVQKRGSWYLTVGFNTCHIISKEYEIACPLCQNYI